MSNRRRPTHSWFGTKPHPLSMPVRAALRTRVTKAEDGHQCSTACTAVQHVTRSGEVVR